MSTVARMTVNGGGLDVDAVVRANRCRGTRQHLVGIGFGGRAHVGSHRKGRPRIFHRWHLPGADDPQRLLAKRRLLEGECKRGLRGLRSIDPDDDSRHELSSQSPAGTGSATVKTWAGCVRRPGTASEATIPTATTAAQIEKVIV